jgi:hypothetical protein
MSAGTITRVSPATLGTCGCPSVARRGCRRRASVAAAPQGWRIYPYQPYLDEIEAAKLRRQFGGRAAKGKEHVLADHTAPSPFPKGVSPSDMTRADVAYVYLFDRAGSLHVLSRGTAGNHGFVGLEHFRLVSSAILAVRNAPDVLMRSADLHAFFSSTFHRTGWGMFTRHGDIATQPIELGPGGFLGRSPSWSAEPGDCGTRQDSCRVKAVRRRRHPEVG